jgi:Protein of unknown function (DUF3224)
MMGRQVTARFTVESWDEVPWDDQDDLPKLTRATVSKQIAGDVQGRSSTVWLMAYGVGGSADFVGLERVHGTVAGRTGSFVLRHTGRFEDGAARGSLEAVAGSGTGQLTGLTGEGTFLADPEGSISLDLTVPGAVT